MYMADLLLITYIGDWEITQPSRPVLKFNLLTTPYSSPLVYQFLPLSQPSPLNLHPVFCLCSWPQFHAPDTQTEEAQN